MFLSQSARVAYVNQELPLDEKNSLKDLVKGDSLDEQKRTFQLLINLGLSYDQFHIAMGELSRGERMKIAIGLAIIREYDLLILDEPNNHLDLYSREALEESLIKYNGTILIISHDRYLLERICDHMLVFDKQKITRIEGALTDYWNRNHPDYLETDAEKAVSQEQKLLLETKISRVLGELSRYQPGDPIYNALDDEYRKLILLKNKLTKYKIEKWI